MASDASVSTSEPVPDSPPSDSNDSSEDNPSQEAPADGGVNIAQEQQIRLKSEDGKIVLTLPPEMDAETDNPACALTWAEISQQIKQRLHAGERLWQADTTVHLMTRDRLLDGRQLQEIVDSLAEVQLRLERVFTSRRQTAVAAATAGYSVEQQSAIAQINPSNTGSASALAEPLYLQTTLRSGGDVQHNGTVIILGDLNPGSSVVADGDILVWGRLRGIAHAGAKGNARCLIMALQMDPTQLRIADFVARAPETPPDHQYYPEVAYVTPQGAIRIARAMDFYRSQTTGREK